MSQTVFSFLRKILKKETRSHVSVVILEKNSYRIRKVSHVSLVKVYMRQENLFEKLSNEVI